MRKKTLLPILILVIGLLAIFPIGMASQSDMTAHGATTQVEQSIKPNGFGEYLTEYYTGKVLYEHNAESRHEIASMVKIMTANLIFEAVDAGKLSYDEMVTISPEAASMGGSQMFLDSGAQYSVNDLLKGIIVV